MKANPNYNELETVFFNALQGADDETLAKLLFQIDIRIDDNQGDSTLQEISDVISDIMMESQRLGGIYNGK